MRFPTHSVEEFFEVSRGLIKFRRFYNFTGVVSISCKIHGNLLPGLSNFLYIVIHLPVQVPGYSNPLLVLILRRE